jgi:hypothetical protein
MLTLHLIQMICLQLNFYNFVMSFRLIIILQNTLIIIRGYKYVLFFSSYAQTNLLLFPGTQQNSATVPRVVAAHNFWEGESSPWPKKRFRALAALAAAIFRDLSPCRYVLITNISRICFTLQLPSIIIFFFIKCGLLMRPIKLAI